jgi:hypothetical protein
MSGDVALVAPAGRTPRTEQPVPSRVAPAVLDRFKTGPAATVAGALLLILGGVVVIAHRGLAGTTIALLGCLIVLRERARQRRNPPG